MVEMVNGDHIIVVYEEPAELLGFAVPFLARGLAQGERCIYVVDDLPLMDVQGAFRLAGVDVARETERGALMLMNAREFAQPPVTPAHIIGLFRDRISNSRSQGYRGLRVAVEMTWTATLAVPDETIIQIESLFESALGDTVTVACMYRRDRFSTAVLQQVLHTHPKVVAGDPMLVSFTGLFEELPRPDLLAFLAPAKERRVQKGGYYFRQGEPSGDVFVLTAGRVKTVRADPEGRDMILGYGSAPELFGHIAGFSGKPHVISVQAIEDSRALVWDVQTVLRVITAHPEVSKGALHFLATQTYATVDHSMELIVAPTERRLARFLHRLARSMGRETPSGIMIEIELSGEDLADVINTTPYTVSRVLAEWRRLKLVAPQRGRFLVIDPQRLASIAGEATYPLLDGRVIRRP